MSVWWGGRIVDGDVAALADDRGMLLGDGLFETIHVVAGAARFADLHLARLAASARALAFHLPARLDEIVAGALPDLVEREGRPARGVLRVTVTRGRGRGLVPPPGPAGLAISFGALPDAVAGRPADAVAAWIVDAPRIDPRDPLAGHKTVSALPRIEARRAAIARGAAVALLATVDGDIACADAANLFAVVDGVVVTPGLDRGVLPGITRGRVVAALRGEGVRVDERRLSSLEMQRASDVFLSSSLDGIRPVSILHGTHLTAPGPLAVWLAARLDGTGGLAEELMALAWLARAQ